MGNLDGAHFYHLLKVELANIFIEVICRILNKF